eukprot:PLAT8619.2.p1 GENE.PLAT8619.2~~PLAT8619.2.p1  ORF type:complete len:259 (+),score=77.48 PLAT8619.2:746-1522(+)
MHLPLPLAAVSTVTQSILRREFHRAAPLWPNAIDGSVFYPAEAKERRHRVLLVGHPLLPLKNFATAIIALNAVHSSLETLEVVWICQVEAYVPTARFPLQTIVNPPQSELPELYRSSADVMLFPSLYESWGMPAMEAMASGIPLVTSSCFGVGEFALHGHNCLVVPPTDAASMAAAVLTLLLNEAYAEQLAAAGRQSVLRFTWEAAVEAMEESCYRLRHFFPRRRRSEREADDEEASDERAGEPGVDMDIEDGKEDAP